MALDTAPFLSATARAAERLPVWVVPHTHWDREWYRPFQEFRLRLVDLMDSLLALMESDEGFAHFMLDGQMAVVDDYLQMRPLAEERIAKLAASGRLSVGPWYILMDEFLVSGETIVRDLQMGLARASDFGAAMGIGYLPDMFGHIAQMPQILRLAGMDRGVVWRGVPSGMDASRFVWRSPDGSEVLSEYLVFGYGNGAALPSDGKRASEMVAGYLDEVSGFHRGEGILLMNGTDHQMPRPWLSRLIRDVNAAQEDFELTVCSLPEALDALSPGGLDEVRGTLPLVEGELRSSARANLLMGVSSNRVDVKQAAARAERALEKRAEPLCALFAPPTQWPDPFFDEAWKLLVLNSAHDSSCACSVDEVVDAVLHRYAEARQIGNGLADRVIGAFASSLSSTGAVLVNGSARSRSAVVEVTLPGTDCPEGCQTVTSRPEVLFEGTVESATARALMSEIRSQQISDDTFIVDVDIETTSTAIEVALSASDRLGREFAIQPFKEAFLAAIASAPDLPVHIKVSQEPTCRVLSRSAEVPGYGWQPWEPAAPAHPVSSPGPTALTNGLVTVEVDPSDGTFAVNGTAGFDRLVDGGDYGDTYNYSPPRNDRLVDTPGSVSVEVVEEGPVRGVVKVVRTFAWPTQVDAASRSREGEEEVEVTTFLTVCADESLVRVDTSLTNPCRDHRLRTHFPLPSPATVSSAECAFCVVDRPLVAEGGPTEKGLATYPSRRFVAAGGLTVLHEGLLEYELLDAEGRSIEGAGTSAQQLALTLLRATGMLSRVEMTYRPLPAGPAMPTEGSQVLGPHHFRYAVALGDVDPYRLCDDAFLPLEVVVGLGEGNRPPSGRILEVVGGEVSAVLRKDGEIELRVFNPGSAPVAVTVADGSGTPASGEVIDLTGRVLGTFTGSVPLGPWKIATLRLSGI